MVNEAVLVFETAPPIPFTCANDTGIERGAALSLADLMTVAKVTDSSVAQGGILAEEKIANDGKTKVPVYREGIFKVTASGSVTVGQAVAFETNYAGRCASTDEFQAGIALETATSNETFLMELRPGSLPQA